MAGILIEKISTTSEIGVPLAPCNLWLEIVRFAFLLYHHFENKATKKNPYVSCGFFFMDICYS